ncbi:MAG: uracil-DNA glycosylase [Methanosarcinaceae archaeon]|nr:uracil-DNA glycosylase [Methanosarcinaceae archaeon]
MDLSARVKENSDLHKENSDLHSDLYNSILNCTRCPLHETVQNKVISKGSDSPSVLFIGEAPGKNEDETGVPFCGRAGKLLDSLISDMNLSYEQAAVINAVKCRPPKNRTPNINEIESCRPFLEAQINLLNPKIIILLGNTAEKAYGITLDWGVPFFEKETERFFLKFYHPAALIYRRERIDEQKRFIEKNKHLWE